MENQTALSAADDLRHRLRTSAAISRIADKPLPLPGAVHGGIMTEPTTAAAAGALALKLTPAALGAFAMACVDPPQSKRELFARLFVAGACQYLFGDIVFEMLHNLPWLAFLDAAKRAHTVAVDGAVGGLGWFVMGAVSMYAQRFRKAPIETIAEVRKAVP